MVDVLFVHARSSPLIYQELSTDFSAIEPPVWAGMLANHCRSRGYSVEILDCEAMGYDDGMACHIVKSLNPRLVAVVVYGQQPSASTQSMSGATSFSKLLREHNETIPILFVGGHIAALPKETLERHPEINFICQNEGVYTLSTLLASNLKDQLDRVPGLGYRKDGTIVLNPPAPVVPQERLELDLPGVAWDLLPIKRYRTALWHSYSNHCDRSQFASLYTSLGCPFACSFCCINAPFGARQFRYWDPKVTIKEFDKLAAMGVKNVKISDEMFVLNDAHFLKLCDLIIERGYHFNIWCYARIDTIKQKYLPTLKKAGVNWLGLGIESGVKAVRSNVIKGKFEDFDVQEIVYEIHEHGMNVAANYIFGLPEDTHTTMLQTFSLAVDLNTEMANFYCCMAYPGSPLYQTAIANGWTLPDTYSGYSQHSYDCRPLPSKYIDAPLILGFRDAAWETYHTNPVYLQNLKKRFGQYSADITLKSTEIKLKRRLLEEFWNKK